MIREDEVNEIYDEEASEEFMPGSPLRRDLLVLPHLSRSPPKSNVSSKYPFRSRPWRMESVRVSAGIFEDPDDTDFHPKKEETCLPVNSSLEGGKGVLGSQPSVRRETKSFLVRQDGQISRASPSLVDTTLSSRLSLSKQKLLPSGVPELKNKTVFTDFSSSLCHTYQNGKTRESLALLRPAKVSIVVAKTARDMTPTHLYLDNFSTPLETDLRVASGDGKDSKGNSLLPSPSLREVKTTSVKSESPRLLPLWPRNSPISPSVSGSVTHSGDLYSPSKERKRDVSPPMHYAFTKRDSSAPFLSNERQSDQSKLVENVMPSQNDGKTLSETRSHSRRRPHAMDYERSSCFLPYESTLDN